MIRPLQILFLILTLITSTALTIGVTYAPCYATLCSEEFFPYETRLHIAIYYVLLASTGCFLFARAYSSAIYNLSNYHLTRHQVPVLQKHISIGGVALSIWILGVTLATTAFWVNPELAFWKLRTEALNWSSAEIKLAVTGIIGHHADYLMGLVIIPVSRNSILGQVFHLHQSTLLYAHKLLAYLLVIAGLAHGLTYVGFIIEHSSANKTKRELFHVDNPTLTEAQAKEKGGWYSATLYTGIIPVIMMVVITITALPIIRRKGYNTFYYIHVVLSIAIFIAVSFHASTDFYFLLPGILLWIVDWYWRIFRGQGGLRKSVTGTVENVGSGWYKIALPVAAKLTNAREDLEQAIDQKKLPSHPIQSYYLNFPGVSKIQNHPFTAASVGSSESGPMLLFQRVEGKKQKKLEKEWTWKLGAFVPSFGDTKELEVRVEGPYSPGISGFETASQVICIVGGTGLTGAYSLAVWWLSHRRHDEHARFHLIWTLRHPETAEFKQWQELVSMAEQVPNMTISKHISSENGRLNSYHCLKDRLSGARRNSSVTEAQELAGRDGAWVYVSGPEGLLTAAETACMELKRELKKAKQEKETQFSVNALDFYLAKWEV